MRTPLGRLRRYRKESVKISYDDSQLEVGDPVISVMYQDDRIEWSQGGFDQKPDQIVLYTGIEAQVYKPYDFHGDNKVQFRAWCFV